MNVEREAIEVTRYEDGYKLHLSTDEAKILLAALGKANFEEVAQFVKNTFNGEEVNRSNDTLYKMYNDLYDVVVPSKHYYYR